MNFSVVLTNYNYGRYLEESVGSVLAQRLPPLEVLVVDDGSTDESRERLADLARRSPLIHVLLKENGGQASAFIEGVAAARGDIVAFMDADDAWDPEYLARIGAIYAERPDVDFVYTNVELSGNREGLFFTDRGPDQDMGFSLVIAAFQPKFLASPTSAISMKRALARRVLDLPPEMVAEWRSRADDCLAFGTDLLGGHKYYCADALVRYRAHGANVWLDRDSDSVADYRYLLRKARMLAHYRSRAGVTPAFLRYIKREFRTKANPSRATLELYLTVLHKAQLPWGKKLEYRLALYRHYWASRPNARAPLGTTPEK